MLSNLVHVSITQYGIYHLLIKFKNLMGESRNMNSYNRGYILYSTSSLVNVATKSREIARAKQAGSSAFVFK